MLTLGQLRKTTEFVYVAGLDSADLCYHLTEHCPRLPLTKPICVYRARVSHLQLCDHCRRWQQELAVVNRMIAEIERGAQ